ncbi:MAG: amidase [Chromatiales bacterium]|jgi:amidase|nr:amidase [Chromatiales bacterium]
MDELIGASATALAEAISSRTVSAEEVMQAHLERVDALNPTINAICTINEQALSDARACDARLASGGSPRALEGVPVVVKDNIETAGLRTTYGSLTSEHNVPVADAVLVERLRAAGAVVVGKSNTPEFAADINTRNAVFGQTRNPWDLNVTPGGSSGGTAAAVSSAMVPVGIGTDLGGSIRIPAAFTGLVGLRPSPGRVPVYPQEFAWDTLIAHVQGPMARTVEDLARVFSVIAGPDERDPSTLPAVDSGFWRLPPDPAAALAGTKVAYIRDLAGLVPLDHEVRALVDAALADLANDGCEVTEDSFDASDLRAIMGGTRAFNVMARLSDKYADYPDAITVPIANQVRAALQIDVATVVQAERARSLYWHRVRALLERYDFLVTPTVTVPPFRLDEALPTTIGGHPVAHFYDAILTTYAFSVTGLPALSVPCGFTPSGLPVGLQIVGHRHREDRVLAFGAGYLAAHPGHTRRPLDIDLASVKPVSEDFSSPGVSISK